MNAFGTQPKRIDLELRKCGFEGSTQYFEFQAMNSFGQEFVQDELGLRGMGEARMKLCESMAKAAGEVMQRAIADGLEVHLVNVDPMELL